MVFMLRKQKHKTNNGKRTTDELCERERGIHISVLEEVCRKSIKKTILRNDEAQRNRADSLVNGIILVK